jgi:hypothetical protein
MPSGTAAIDGSDATLMPCAKSDAFGVVVEVAIELNASTMPTTVITTHAAAKVSDAIPDQINHRVARVFRADELALPDSYGFSTIRE